MYYYNIRVVPYSIKGRVDIVLVKEDFRKGVEDAYIQDVSPTPALCRGVERSESISGITLVQKIVECACVCILNNVTGGVNHNPSLAIAEYKRDRRQE